MAITLKQKNKLIKEIKIGSITSKILPFKRYFLLIDLNKYLVSQLLIEVMLYNCELYNPELSYYGNYLLNGEKNTHRDTNKYRDKLNICILVINAMK